VQIGNPLHSFFPSAFCESPDRGIPFAETVAQQIADGNSRLLPLIQFVESQETRFTVRVDNAAKLLNCLRDFASARTASAFQPSVEASINGGLNFLFTPGKLKLIAC
jgi:hypothetical protein